MTTSLERTSSTNISANNESEKSNPQIHEDVGEKDLSVADEYTAQNSEVVLLERLRTQIEFYFSPQNMARDTYLRSLLSYSHHHPNGVVPLSIIATFPKVRKLCCKSSYGPGSAPPPADPMLLKKALEGSLVVALSPDGAWIIPLFQTYSHQPMGQQHQIISTHSHQFAPPPLPERVVVNQQKDTQELFVVTKKRTTVILRDIAESCDVQKVLAAFTTDIVTPKSARPDIGKTWYVTFASESDAISAVSAAKGRKIDGQSIRARVKSEVTNPSTETSRSVSPAQNPQPLPHTHSSQNGIYVPANTGEPEVLNSSSTVGQQQVHTTSVTVPYVRSDGARNTVGMQVHLHHQPPPAGYAPFPHTAQTQYYTTHQQVYPHHYGMPLHIAQPNSASGSNYSFGSQLQSYGHQGNSVRSSVHQYPYFVNNAPVLQHKEHYRRRGDNRNGNDLQHNEHVVPHIPISGNAHLHESANSALQANFTAHNKHVNTNPNEVNRNGKFVSHVKVSNTLDTATSIQADGDGKPGAKDHNQQKGNRNSGIVRGRNQKADGPNSNYTVPDNYGNKNSIIGNGERKVKNKKTRNKKDKNNGGNGTGSRQNPGPNGSKSSSIKPVSKDATVLNALNFPELKIDGRPSSDDTNPDSSISVSEDSAIGVGAPGKLTGYAAALLKKRSNMLEESI